MYICALSSNHVPCYEKVAYFGISGTSAVLISCKHHVVDGKMVKILIAFITCI